MPVAKPTRRSSVAPVARRVGGVMASKRKTPRAPILTQVEAQGDRLSALGRACDISVGGLLIETSDTLAEGATVVVRFFVPPQRQPIEAAGRVVRVDPGKSMAIAFLGLPENHKQRILDYIHSIQGTPAEKLLLEPHDSKPRQRRSARLSRRVAVVLNWQDEAGRTRQEAAETHLLSKYGAMVLSFSEIRPGQLVRMAVPDKSKEGLSRVVWTAAAQLPGRVALGMEFVGVEDFWGVEFAADKPAEPEVPKIARRRSARLPRRIDIVLNWVDELGRVREEFAQTKMLSKHGAAVSSLVGLPVKHRFRLRAPEMNREAESHVVWAQPGEVPGRTDMGVEFLEAEDFWGIPFPPDPGSPKT